MQIRVNTDDLTEMFLENNFGQHLSVSGDTVLEINQSADLIFGKGNYREIIFEGVHIGYGTLSLRKNTRLSFQSVPESIEMHFLLQGKSLTTLNNRKEKTLLKSNQHTLIYSKDFVGNVQWEETTDMKVFEINFSRQFFAKYLPLLDIHFNEFKQAINNGETAYISDQHRPIPASMLHVIQEILYCDKKGIFKKMYLEAKIVELLILQLEQFKGEGNLVDYTLSKKNIEKIHYAKDLVLERLFSPLSLTKLAQKANTNEFTLKKGFKEVFGTTVYGFINDQKMEKAKQLLLMGEKNIAEIAALMGYKYPTHFTSAFKKKYGFIPSNMRKK